LDERNQPLALAVPYHHHIVGAGGEQVTDSSQRHTFRGDDLETFEIEPVVLILTGRRQLFAGDVDVLSHQRCSHIPIVHLRQFGYEALALRVTFGTRDLHVLTRRR
jgi:hypothetical protein